MVKRSSTPRPGKVGHLLPIAGEVAVRARLTPPADALRAVVPTDAHGRPGQQRALVQERKEQAYLSRTGHGRAAK